MSVTRINEFQAREGEGDAVRELVESFAPTIRASAGCHSCRVLQGDDDPSRVVVIEEWESVPDHRAAAESIPPETLARAKALLAAPPRGGYFRG